MLSQARIQRPCSGRAQKKIQAAAETCPRGALANKRNPEEPPRRALMAQGGSKRAARRAPGEAWGGPDRPRDAPETAQGSPGRCQSCTMCLFLNTLKEVHYDSKQLERCFCFTIAKLFGISERTLGAPCLGAQQPGRRDSRGGKGRLEGCRRPEIVYASQRWRLVLSPLRHLLLSQLTGECQ